MLEPLPTADALLGREAAVTPRVLLQSLSLSLARSLTAQAKNIVGITRYLSYNLLVWWMLVVGEWDRDRGKEEERLVVW